ncbi:MAG: hypothetical protein QMC37_01040, partial [Flavobacteriales bacterium]
MSTSIEYECDVEELKNSEACDDEPLNLPTKDLKGVVGVTCNVPGQNKRTRQTCWAPQALRGTLTNYSQKTKSDGGRDEFVFPFPKAPAGNPFQGLDPFQGEAPRTFVLKHSQEKKESLDEMLERLEVKYDEVSTEAVRKRSDDEANRVILDLEKWNTFVRLGPTPSEIWTEKPLGELLRLYYLSRIQSNFYEQLREGILFGGNTIT